ncbi:hypothetical protein PRUPE_4G228500 [Prunus persica]|uniref:Uncharacterized protein n=1 Tax=Prunus persica TaxID=3760 RepID=A0A251PPP6_PRUPE|nr:hypothetical protein PRUPE_4G228500 [Prunus persica]
MIYWKKAYQLSNTVVCLECYSVFTLHISGKNLLSTVDSRGRTHMKTWLGVLNPYIPCRETLSRMFVLTTLLILLLHVYLYYSTGIFY